MAEVTAKNATAFLSSRRRFLAGAGAFVAWSHLPKFARSAGRDPRLLVVILRGAIDGLAVVPPISDPDYHTLRGDLAIGAPGFEPTLPLDGFFGLNNSLAYLHKLYQAREALFVHAVATNYRERSHFDGQDVLESGAWGPKVERTGWLNRAIAVLPKGERIRPAEGLAVSTT